MTSVVAKNDALVDPNVRMPSAVRAHAARADQLQAAAHAPVPDPNTPDPNAPPVDPTPATPPADPPANPPAPAPHARDWENDFRAMQGRFQRSEQDKVSLQGRINDLERTIATMQQPTVAPTTTPDPALNARNLITDTERAEFGTEFLDVAGRAAEERLSPLVSRLEGQIADLKKQLGQVGSVVQNSTRQQLFTYLDTELPNWSELNTNSDFLTWLDLPDQFSGAKRKELLTRAYDENNAPRVLAFFKGFLTEQGAVSPQPTQTAQPSQTPTGQPKVDLATLASPGRAKSPAGQTPQSKPFYTRAQIAAFYTDVTAGRYRGREDERDRIEKDLFAAQNEGRVQ